MISDNLIDIKRRIDSALLEVGRKPESCTLIGVSKTKPISQIKEAYRSGLRDFGENYVEEFNSKYKEYKPEGFNYHFIGKLPTKKVRKIVGNVKLIHSVSSLKLAKKIDFVSQEEGIVQDILLQINQGGELSKSGFYDGLTFHRVIAGFMAQGGDPNGDGTGGRDKNIIAEFNDIKHTKGILSMARSNDKNSAGSQFFICDGNPSHLDAQYTVFGKVIEGLDIIDKIAGLPRDNRNNPLKRIDMKIRLKPKNL